MQEYIEQFLLDNSPYNRLSYPHVLLPLQKSPHTSKSPPAPPHVLTLFQHNIYLLFMCVVTFRSLERKWRNAVSSFTQITHTWLQHQTDLWDKMRF